MSRLFQKIGDGIDKAFGSVKYAVDLTPFDKSGNSTWGLKRTEAKVLAWAFMFLGLMFLSPPFDAIPNDFLNFYAAGFIQNILPNVSYSLILLGTYIIIGPVLFLIGIWIYPHNTGRLLSSYINKGKSFIKQKITDPKSIVIGIIIWYIAFRIYSGWLI